MVRIENNKLIIEVGADDTHFSPVETLHLWKEAIIRIVQRYDNKDYVDNPVYWLMDIMENLSPNIEQAQRGFSNDGEVFDLPANISETQRKMIVGALYGIKYGELPSSEKNPVFDLLKKLNS